MTKSADADRAPILDAVQAALTDFGEQARAEFDSLRAAVASEKAARLAAEERVAELAAALEASEQRAAARHNEISQLIDSSVGAIRAPLDERIESLESWSDASTDASNELEARLAASESRAVEFANELAAERSQRTEAVEAVGVSAAGLMATHAAMESRLDAADEQAQSDLAAATAALTESVDARVIAVESRAAELADELAAERLQRTEAVDAVGTSTAGLVAMQAAIESRLDAADERAQADLDTAAASLTESVDAHFVAAESRLSEQFTETERKVTDELQARVAEINEEFEQVAAGAESSIAALNERSNAIDERLGVVVERLTALEAVVAEIDVDAIDDLSERVSTAAGEAVLIRIETERFQESVKETNDKMVVRISDVESQLQAQEMDVETAVQLERLEEIERALIELDPAQFVRVDGDRSTSTARSNAADVPFIGSTGETGDVIAGRADAPRPPKPTLPSSSG